MLTVPVDSFDPNQSLLRFAILPLLLKKFPITRNIPTTNHCCWKTRIDRVKMAQSSCSFATNCRTKCYFSRAGQGRQQLIPLNSWVYSLKKTFERRRCIPNMRFVRDGAYSSAYWLIWRLRRPRFHDVPQISCTTWCEIQTFGFVNASILLIKIGDIK